LSSDGPLALVLWIASGVAVVFALYLIIDALVAWRRRCREALRLSETQNLSGPGADAPSAQPDHYDVACRHCAATVRVPKVHRFNAFLCPNCENLNPPVKKDRFIWAKAYLRSLLHP
jgi:hypothetical protein